MVKVRGRSINVDADGPEMAPVDAWSVTVSVSD
jgi:hypothetical protein